MKVAYLLNWRFGETSGVFQKVMAQSAEWHRVGVEVGIFIGTTPQAVDEWARCSLTKGIATFESAGESLVVQRRLLAHVQDWQPDITYVRTSPRLIAALPGLRRVPHVIEVQTDDVAEARLLPPQMRWPILATRRALLRGAKGIVFVSRELASSPSFRSASSNRVVIANGADLRQVEPLLPPPLDEIRMSFVEHSQAPWHGKVQVYALAEHRSNWHIDVIGPEGEPGIALPPNIHHHGRLPQGDLMRVLQQSTVALSTLSLYAIGMSEASPLKSREYLARGLPVVGGYMDTDLPDDCEYYLRVPNRPGGVLEALPELDSFIERWRGRRVPRSLITHLDVTVKEQQRLEFLQSCIESRS